MARTTETREDPAARWVGYRAGVLVMDESVNRVGVSTAFDGMTYTLVGVDGSATWQADVRSVRLATDTERQALRLAPRSAAR
ncbi:hypothetical protein GCM10010218_36500 [Streptomyces mashuensis]|uniref:Uncharacterized protein n=1 Tax=Streptomyces mashuensis TaxID=33904 RepID=A0A919EE82_9ACTN|nr:hypothetical protein [Streptomyces mashuensis]GHF51586.1 hypothetical protein GCM10010218_36500 [Streptomyces mashuensis]